MSNKRRRKHEMRRACAESEVDKDREERGGKREESGNRLKWKKIWGREMARECSGKRSGREKWEKRRERKESDVEKVL